jgi:uncharacterized cupredoxin-like copper-binding protein
VSGEEWALAAIAAVFVAFSLVVSMVVPRYRPEFPGKGGVGVFVLGSVVLFLATMTAVWVFVPSHGAHAETGHVESDAAETTPHQTVAEGEEGQSETGEEEVSPAVGETEGSETEPAGPATTAAGESAQTIEVVATEFKLEVDTTELAPSRYTFELDNEGQIPHDLVIEGPDIDNTKTPVIGGGEKAKIDVALQPGTYKLYCSVPGHEAAGMVTEITVG